MQIVPTMKEMRPRLLKYLQENPMTPKQLADLIDVSPMTIRNVVYKAEHEVQMQVALKINKFLLKSGF